MNDNVENGIVKWFNAARGYGFIRRENGEEVFVHFSEIRSDGFRKLSPGEEVDFEVVSGERGLHAVNVFRRRLDTRAAAAGAAPQPGSGDEPED